MPVARVQLTVLMALRWASGTGVRVQEAWLHGHGYTGMATRAWLNDAWLNDAWLNDAWPDSMTHGLSTPGLSTPGLSTPGLITPGLINHTWPH